MKAFLKKIAVIDKEEKVHSVEFGPGVNVITGKSSTGKSAMIEIFDYCFGNSDFTVPVGVITDNAKLYYIIIKAKDTYSILAREPEINKAFIKEETDEKSVNNLSTDYFSADYFLTLGDFKIELGRYFGISVTDTDEDLEDRKYRRHQAKSPRPSVRNFTSFLLQHQNLVANKHSLFYRFDEKEKREQTIDQFKIFTSFVDQEYFTKKQKLNEYQRDLKMLVNKDAGFKVQREAKIEVLSELMKEYLAITGIRLLDETPTDILRNPAKYLDELTAKRVEYNPESNEFLDQLNNYKKQRNILISEKRNLQIELKDIDASIRYTEEYRSNVEGIYTQGEVELHLSECPFCHSKNEKIVDEANKLERAIEWLNDELGKTPYMLESFEADKKKIINEIGEKDGVLKQLNKSIKNIEGAIDELKNNRSLEEQALKIKLKIENYIESILGVDSEDIEGEIKNTKKKIKEIEKELKQNYDVDRHLRQAETYINQAMNDIGGSLEFEATYTPINLRFSLDTFELWHEKEDGKKVYLRSMGSGANWLYCHISLFTSLHRYFCSLKQNSLVPPILFLDQPSQVYFPANIDTDTEFNAGKLKEKEGKKKRADEDLVAVTNMFNQLVKFCKDTLSETDIEPQIIITDHADHLQLDEVDFEKLVDGRRWRTRGFIEQ
jgi:hypothetical protein